MEAFIQSYIGRSLRQKRRRVNVLPDTAQPILDAIGAATRTLRVKMFVLSDPAMLKELTSAQVRGVNVRVMLNPTRRSGEEENALSREALTKAGIVVNDSNPAFDVTHEKSMVIDEEIALVQSLNWDPMNFTKTRDYAILTKHQHDVAEIARCFESDWHRKPFEPRADSRLILVQPVRAGSHRTIHR